jgi:nitroimidazol reductase NimA-like FMN-containing flavoprotein (pyridoxamine 5'-phosphate oxidase superfamily)
MVTGPRRLAEPTREESLRLLARARMGRIVFTHQALPAIRPVNHLLDDGHVIIRSHLGAALVTAAGSATGVVVAYEADAIDSDDHLGWSVVVTGTAHLVRDPGEVARYQQQLARGRRAGRAAPVPAAPAGGSCSASVTQVKTSASNLDNAMKSNCQ